MQHFNGHIACRTQAHCQVIQARLVARNKDEVVAPVGEALGVGGADAAGGTGDEDSRKRGHGFFLCIRRSGGGQTRLPSHFDHDLALGSALGKVFECFLCFLERKHLVDHWLDALGFEKFADFGELSAVGMYEEK
ncbi:hypothetical protein D9M71_475450 [compost metagenome]